MRLWMRQHRLARNGFTIIELLVVMAVLGVLAAAIMPLGEALLRAQKERELKQALWEIRNAIAQSEGLRVRRSGWSIQCERTSPLFFTPNSTRPFCRT
jgi:prepilin-type N-terminal cleavage/methylation domain-containing protein